MYAYFVLTVQHHPEIRMEIVIQQIDFSESSIKVHYNILRVHIPKSNFLIYDINNYLHLW